MNILTVDGIDVSGCDAYTHNHNELMPYGDVKVTEHYCWHINSNCDGKECEYKQLKRLEQENEQLKADIESRTMCITCERELQNCNLKAENERLKEELRNNSDVLIHEMGLKDEYQSDYVFEKLERQKYKQALQEIREIARNEVETRMLFSDKKSFCDFNNILTKINEVIGAEE